MLDADSRPSFEELREEFAKMARDPGRYLVIPVNAGRYFLCTSQVNCFYTFEWTTIVAGLRLTEVMSKRSSRFRVSITEHLSGSGNYMSGVRVLVCSINF